MYNMASETKLKKLSNLKAAKCYYITIKLSNYNLAIVWKQNHTWPLTNNNKITELRLPTTS